MNRKTYKEKINCKIDFNRILKYSLIEKLKWYEDELNELYLFKIDYNKQDITHAKKIIEKIKNLDYIYIDRQLNYLVDETLRKIKIKYPEFF